MFRFWSDENLTVKQQVMLIYARLDLKCPMSRKYNLKTNYNWRGDIAELLAHYRYNAWRTKGYGFKKHRWDILLKEHSAFLDYHWETIDMFTAEDGDLVLYEVKSRTAGVRRKPDITRSTTDCYREAGKLGIKVMSVTVFFHDDWEISFDVKPYNEEDYRINDGGWYRK